jgi:uncharacterized damage-inducible protein DinB
MAQQTTVTDEQRADLLAALAEAAKRIRRAVEGIPEEQHGWQPGAESWSVCMTVAHLARAEPLFRQRFRRMFAEDNPVVPYFGPDSALPDTDRPFGELLRWFTAERDETIALLRGVPPDAWARPAVHETMGPTTVLQQVENIVDHDTVHLGQIAAVVRQWQTEAAGPEGNDKGGAHGKR